MNMIQFLKVGESLDYLFDDVEHLSMRECVTSSFEAIKILFEIAVGAVVHDYPTCDPLLGRIGILVLAICFFL